MPKKTFFALSEEKRKLIERAAIEVINARGYDKTTIKEIVNTAGIPRGSFYQYFDGTGDLFDYLIHVIGEKKKAYMKDLFGLLQKKPFLDLFPEFTKAGLLYAEEDKEAYLFGYHLYHSQSEVVLTLRTQIETEGIEMIKLFLQQDLNRGWLKQNTDIDLLAKLLFDFNARDLIYQFYRGVSFDSMLERTKAFVEILSNGVKKEDVYE